MYHRIDIEPSHCQRKCIIHIRLPFHFVNPSFYHSFSKLINIVVCWRCRSSSCAKTITYFSVFFSLSISLPPSADSLTLSISFTSVFRYLVPLYGGMLLPRNWWLIVIRKDCCSYAVAVVEATTTTTATRCLEIKFVFVSMKIESIAFSSTWVDWWTRKWVNNWQLVHFHCILPSFLSCSRREMMEQIDRKPWHRANRIIQNRKMKIARWKRQRNKSHTSRPHRIASACYAVAKLCGAYIMLI